MRYAWTRATEAGLVPASAAGPEGATSVRPQGSSPIGVIPAQRVEPSANSAPTVGAVLTRLYGYLEAQAPTHPRLADAFDELGSAIAALGAPTADPYAGARQVLATIQRVRAADPQIPDA